MTSGLLCRIYTVLWWNSGLCEIMLGGSWLAAAKLNGDCPVGWFTPLVSGCQALTLSEPWTAPASWKERSKVPPFLPNRWNDRHRIFSYARTDCSYGALISMHLLCWCSSARFRFHNTFRIKNIHSYLWIFFKWRSLKGTTMWSADITLSRCISADTIMIFFLKPVRDGDGSTPSISASFYGSSYCRWGTLEPDSESERNGVITEQIYFLVDSGEKQVQGYQLSFSGKVPARHNRWCFVGDSWL